MSKAICVVAAVIETDGRYLITQRRASASLPLMWEFPGGKIEPGEGAVDALKREVLYRLGVTIQVGELISRVNHRYEKYEVELGLYSCSISSGEAQRKNVHDYRWVTSKQFDSVAFTPADEQSMNQLLGIN